MKKKKRRAGASETFSVSVETETKQALRALAKQDFGENLSALVTDLAEEVRRRLAADAYLRRHEMSVPTRVEADALQMDISRDIASHFRSSPNGGGGGRTRVKRSSRLAKSWDR